MTRRRAAPGRRAARAARLPRPPLLRPRRPRDRRRRLRRAARRAARDRGRAPRAASRPTRRPSGSAASRSRKLEKVTPPAADALARQRALGGGAARLGRADAHPPRARGDRGPGRSLRRRAEDRRPGDLAASTATACSSAAPRAATARSARTSPTTCARSARSRCGSTDAPPLLEVRGEVYMSLPDFAALNERRAEAGPVDVHEPAQLGRGHDPPARPGARRRAPAVDVVLRHRRHRGARARARTGRRSSGCASTASASTATSRGSRPRTRSSPQCLAWQERRGALDFEIDGVVVKVDDVELQRRLGVVGPRPALGDRLEVPADDGGDDAARGQWNVGKFGDLHPFARARAGARRRRHREAGDAAQRGGPRAQGRPRPATR